MGLITSQFVSRKCQAVNRLSQTAFLALIEGTPTARYFSALELSDWEIVSFNPTNREVCVQMTKVPVRRTTLTITIPYFTVNELT